MTAGACVVFYPLCRESPRQHLGSLTEKLTGERVKKYIKYAGRLVRNFNSFSTYVEPSMNEKITSNPISSGSWKDIALVEDGFWRLLVKEHMQGQLMWNVIGQGDTALSEADADMIALVIAELRDHPGLYKSHPRFQTYTKYELVPPRFHLFLQQRWWPPDHGYCGLCQILDKSLREGRDQHQLIFFCVWLFSKFQGNSVRSMALKFTVRFSLTFPIPSMGVGWSTLFRLRLENVGR